MQITLPVLRALTGYWQQYPPVHELLQSLLVGLGGRTGSKSANPKQRGRQLVGSLFEMGGGVRAKSKITLPPPPPGNLF